MPLFTMLRGLPVAVVVLWREAVDVPLLVMVASKLLAASRAG